MCMRKWPNFGSSQFSSLTSRLHMPKSKSKNLEQSRMKRETALSRNQHSLSTANTPLKCTTHLYSAKPLHSSHRKRPSNFKCIPSRQVKVSPSKQQGRETECYRWNLISAHACSVTINWIFRGVFSSIILVTKTAHKQKLLSMRWWFMKNTTKRKPGNNYCNPSGCV